MARDSLRSALLGISEVLRDGTTGYWSAKETQARELEELIKEIEKQRKEEIKEKEREVRQLTKQKKAEEKWYENKFLKSGTTKKIESRQKELLRELTGIGANIEEEDGDKTSLADHLKSAKEYTKKNAVSGTKNFIRNMPSGALEIGEGVAGLASKLGPVGGAIGLAKPAISKLKKKYQEFMGITEEDANSFSGQGGRFVGSLAIPGGAPSKIAGKAVPAVARAAGTGGLYGAIMSEAEGEDPVTGGIEGALVGGLLHGAGKLARKIFPGKKTKLAKELKTIKENALIKDPEKIADRAAIMGKDATIGEIVGSEKAINRIKKDTSKSNIKRLEGIEENILKKGQSITKKVPNAQEGEKALYKNLSNLKDEVLHPETGKVSKLYGDAKEFALGKDGVLEPKILKEWSRSMREVMPHMKGLPNMKSTGLANGKELKNLEMFLTMAPADEKAYRKFVVENIDKVPTAEDFLKFRSKIKSALGKSDVTNKEPLTVLMNSLDKIIEKTDKTQAIAKADQYYASHAIPLKQKKVQEAVKSVKLSGTAEGAPSIKSVFGKQSIQNSDLFKQMPADDKKRVVYGFIEDALSSKHKENPVRAIHEAWHSLPEYIKRSSDKDIQKILKEMKRLAGLNKTLTSLQSTTKADIGSRQAVESAAKNIRPLAYLTSLFSGRFTPTALAAATEYTGKAFSKLSKKAYRKRTGQKNLKYYLKPEMLDEILIKEQQKAKNVPLSKLLITQGDND